MLPAILSPSESSVLLFRGHHGGNNNIFYGVACNGEGVAMSQTAGRIISDLIAGERSDLLGLFVVNHKIPYMGPTSTRIVLARLYKWYLTRFGSKTVR